MNRFFLPGSNQDEYFYGAHAAWIGAAFFMVVAKFFAARVGIQPLTILLFSGVLGALASACVAGLYLSYRTVAVDELEVAAGKPERAALKSSVYPSVARAVPVVMAFIVMWFVSLVSRG